MSQIQTLTLGVTYQGKRRANRPHATTARKPAATPRLPALSAEDFFRQQQDKYLGSLQEKPSFLAVFMPPKTLPLHRLLYQGSGGMFNPDGRPSVHR